MVCPTIAVPQCVILDYSSMGRTLPTSVQRKEILMKTVPSRLCVQGYHRPSCMRRYLLLLCIHLLLLLLVLVVRIVVATINMYAANGTTDSQDRRRSDPIIARTRAKKTKTKSISTHDPRPHDPRQGTIATGLGYILYPEIPGTWYTWHLVII